MKLKKLKKFKVKKKTRKKFFKHLPWLAPVLVLLVTSILIHKHPRDDNDLEF